MKPGRAGRRRPERDRPLFDQNLAGMFRTAGDGVILDANESFARTLGHTAPAELLGRHLSEFYVDPARWDRLLAGLRVARTVANLEVPLRRSNNSVVWVLMSVIRGGEDPSAGLEGHVVDITARTRADDLLRETEAEGQSPAPLAACRRRARRGPPRPGARRREGDRGDRRPDEPDHAVGADRAVRDAAGDARPAEVGGAAARARRGHFAHGLSRANPR